MSTWPWTRRNPRVTGIPPSANGASSLHLRWDVPGSLGAAAVDLTVEEAPAVDQLYFWALQVDFVDPAGRAAGAAHLGLQWHPGHPGSTAVNWGGYRAGGGELDGTGSALPSAMANMNTRDFTWRAGTPYRLSVAPAPGVEVVPSETRWRATVTEIDSGTSTVVRDLHVPGDRISGVLVWSEVFARCDDPSVSVRWSNPTGTALDGSERRIRRATAKYQSHADGGCANTDSSPAANLNFPGLRQRTNCDRVTAQSSVIPWP